MAAIKLTAKRQATFPRQICDALRVGPGDQLVVEPQVLDDETVWILRPKKADWSWVGSVHVPANASHDMDQVRASVARGRGRRRP